MDKSIVVNAWIGNGSYGNRPSTYDVLYLAKQLDSHYIYKFIIRRGPTALEAI